MITTSFVTRPNFQFNNRREKLLYFISFLPRQHEIPNEVFKKLINSFLDDCVF